MIESECAQEAIRDANYCFSIGVSFVVAGESDVKFCACYFHELFKVVSSKVRSLVSCQMF